MNSPPRELTATALILGTLIGIVMTAANVYLGLKIGMTVSASIPAAVIAMGITVQSVELKDVKIPAALEDAMSRKAQADREKEARIILADSEVQVARKMNEAAATYDETPTALHLRAMNMTYESIKEKGALMVVPSQMNESLSGVTGLAASAFKVEKPS